MTDALTGAALRRWAMQCAAQAENPRAGGDERERLLRMRTALLKVAETQDWLDGGSREKSAPRQHDGQGTIA